MSYIIHHSVIDTTVNFSVPNILPDGIIMYFNSASCPAGWNEVTAAQERYMVGLVETVSVHFFGSLYSMDMLGAMQVKIFKK